MPESATSRGRAAEGSRQGAWVDRRSTFAKFETELFQFVEDGPVEFRQGRDLNPVGAEAAVQDEEVYYSFREARSLPYFFFALAAGFFSAAFFAGAAFLAGALVLDAAFAIGLTFVKFEWRDTHELLTAIVRNS